MSDALRLKSKTHSNHMDCIAYIKYEGDDIADGIFGARDAADALLGVDKVLHYYVEKEIPELKTVSYDFPVKIQKGSWEILIPSNIDQLITVGGTTTLLYFYLKQAAEVAAKDGLLETGFVKDIKQVISWALRILQLVISYVKHMKGHNKHPPIKFENDSEIVTVFNKNGAPFSFPSKYLQLILQFPSSLLSDMVMPIRGKRMMKIGVYKNKDEFTEETIGRGEKSLFCEEQEEIDELPELVDGEKVSLKGRIVRANEKEQSFGFQYNGHVITCKPKNGLTLASFKDGIISSRRGCLYQSEVEVRGLVERVTVDGRYKTRPRIFVSNVLPTNVDVMAIEQPEFI